MGYVMRLKNEKVVEDMLRMSERQAKEAQRRLKGQKGKTRAQKEEVPTLKASTIDVFESRLDAEFGDAFCVDAQDNNVFWNIDAKVVVLIDDWKCWAPDEEDGDDMNGWRAIHFSSAGLVGKARMDEAMRAVAEGIQRQKDPG
ncbi:MAG: hypothetical protein ACR2QC_08095 [Gammaproteobacteria bacterium]